MEYLAEVHLQSLLRQEWLVKIDNDTSTPYLLKFHASTEEPSCCLLITDTRSVWGEVLSGKGFARRWRECNPSTSTFISDEDKEIEWRTNLLSLLKNIHSIGGIADLSFDIVPSTNADLAFELGSDQFRWRWESYALGPKTSAEVLSKQLIMPLISVSHLAFSSADPVTELSDANLEMAIDRAGRTGRRAVDTHVKHAISKPRLTTSVRRMAAVFNFVSDLPPIVTNAESPDFVIPSVAVSDPPPLAQSNSIIFQSSYRPRSISPSPTTRNPVVDTALEEEAEPILANRTEGNATSATEDEEEGKSSPSPEPPTFSGKAKVHPDTIIRTSTRVSSSPSPPEAVTIPYRSREPSLNTSAHSQVASSSTTNVINPNSDSEAPPRPQKKPKRRPVSSSSDEESDAERKRRVTQVRSAPRGAKQPIKRGGRRF